jgi:hypothetical protein
MIQRNYILAPFILLLYPGFTVKILSTSLLAFSLFSIIVSRNRRRKGEVQIHPLPLLLNKVASSYFRKCHYIIMAISLGTLRTSRIVKVILFNCLIFVCYILSHFFNPFWYGIIWPIENFGKIPA